MTESDGARSAIELGADADAQAVLIRLLVDMGVPEHDVMLAAEAGTLHLLALERLVTLEAAEYTLDEVAEIAGIEADHIRAYWRALGFPEPRVGEKVFSDTDLDMLESVVPFLDGGELATDIAVQMARVIGSSLNRIATAQIEVIEREVSRKVNAMLDVDGESLPADRTSVALEVGADGEDGEVGEVGAVGAVGADGEDGADGADGEVGAELVGAAQQAAELLPMMPRLMEFVWRRHLGAAARRRIVRAAGEEEFDGVCVGFADLVGFTAQTQQLPEDELANVVDRFENIAYDVVSRHGGRVVKMIGDEVMFTIDGAAAGAQLALDLAEEFRDDEHLSDVRVGLASGSVLEREGDVFGPVVNLASRIVSIAYPGSVVVSKDIVDTLEDDGAIQARSIRSYYLKDIGRVPLWTLSCVGDEPEPRYGAARNRRADRRRFVIERRLQRQQQAADLAGEFSDELAMAAGVLADTPFDLVLDVATDMHAPEFTESATTGELAALTDVVLAADIDDDLQVELLADIEAARRLQALEAEALAKAEEADLEVERKLDEIEHEARRKVEAVEKEARFRVDQALQEAEDKAKRANEEANRKVKKVAEDTERKVDRAEKDARREAQRKAAKHRRNK